MARRAQVASPAVEALNWQVSHFPKPRAGSRGGNLGCDRARACANRLLEHPPRHRPIALRPRLFVSLPLENPGHLRGFETRDEEPARVVRLKS